ncbi:MAG: hypothetical protein ACRDXF_12490 [Acidimicrobiia bacterium]
MGEHGVGQESGRARPGRRVPARFYPIVLGTGKKQYTDGFPSPDIALVETRVLLSGVVVINNRRAHAR